MLLHTIALRSEEKQEADSEILPQNIKRLVVPAKFFVLLLSGRLSVSYEWLYNNTSMEIKCMVNEDGEIVFDEPMLVYLNFLDKFPGSPSARASTITSPSTDFTEVLDKIVKAVKERCPYKLSKYSNPNMME